MFLEIVAECKEHNVFGIELRQSKIKVEFKVLTCLKILGRDLCADKIEEHLKIAESTVNKFFKMFIYSYASAMYSKWVNVPEGEDLDRVESTYPVSTSLHPPATPSYVPLSGTPYPQ